MAMLKIGASGKSYIAPASFENEQELLKLLAENPQLLLADGAAPPVLLIQQLILPDAGTLDLLLVDVESVPVVVETRLAGSGDCRREIAARAIDDISALAQMTLEQLDEATGGAVQRALWAFAGDDRNDFNRRRASLASNLRAGRVRFIVAVDELRPSLARMIAFLAEHSSLEVQCVAVAKSLEPNGDSYFTPTIVEVGKLPQPLASPAVAPREVKGRPNSFDRVSSAAGIRLVARLPETPPVDLERINWVG